MISIALIALFLGIDFIVLGETRDSMPLRFVVRRMIIIDVVVVVVFLLLRIGKVAFRPMIVDVGVRRRVTRVRSVIMQIGRVVVSSVVTFHKRRSSSSEDIFRGRRHFS